MPIEQRLTVTPFDRADVRLTVDPASKRGDGKLSVDPRNPFRTKHDADWYLNLGCGVVLVKGIVLLLLAYYTAS